MNDLARAFRDRYLQEVWHRLGLESRGEPIALYGAGEHSRMLLAATASVRLCPKVDVILDDAPQSEHLRGIPVRRPDEVDPRGYGRVVVSSDAHEERLAARAAAWTSRAPAGTRPRLVRLYEGLTAEAMHAPPQITRRLAPHRVRAAGEPFAVPPPALRAGYSVEDAARYLERGAQTNEAIRGALRGSGIDPLGCARILDWGCAAGRVIRFWADVADRAAVWGCDIDEAAIDWAVAHLSPPFRFFSTTLAPSIPVADGAFDLVYGISVFTHISHHVDTWLMELRRITAPGGHVLVTIHDEHTWDRCAREPGLFIARHFPGDFDGPLADDFVASGAGHNSQTFWHTGAVRRRWSALFEIVDLRVAAFCDGTQTGVLMRPRA